MDQQAMKPTFHDLYETYQLHLAQLSQKAGVSPRITYFMLEEQPVPYEDASRVLSTISQETGIAYSPKTVHVKLLPYIQKTGDEPCIQSGN